MEQVLHLNGNDFTLVAIQRDGKTAVYKHLGEYIRIGDPEKIKEDLTLHKRMEAAGLPVARLLGEGEHDGSYYFIESSLGEEHIGKLFEKDMCKKGSIDDETFDLFLSVVERFARAQLRTQMAIKDFVDFANGIHLDILYDELPQYREPIELHFSQVKENLSVFPFVITHGDFNPYNLYPEGVIDLEDSFYGPFGFDVISALVTIDYFPDSEQYEYVGRYRFTHKQHQRYLGLADQISRENNIPPISAYKDDFDFCRGVWQLVRMGKWPKIQQWRYELFIKKFGIS